MIPPLLSQNSRRLLQRFFAREARSSIIKSTSSSSSEQASTSASILQWNSDNNPFQSSLVKNSRGHTKYRSAKYSPRRQKQFYRAMEIVKLQQELFKPIISSQSQQVEDGTEENVNKLENSFALPDHWVLPPSSKSKNMPSFSSEPSTSSSSSSSTLSALSDSSAQQLTYTAKDATKRGPYKGRKNGAFKLHKWERNHQSKLDDRKQKLESMPQRIAEHTKVSRL